MRTIIVSILVMLAHGLLFAEGLPLNDSRTKYEGPHHLLKLNEDQLEEVTVAGTLTLTRAQWQELRKKSPATPKRIDAIYPSTHNDCTCGMEDQSFGVWFTDGTVAIVLENAPTPFNELPAQAKKELSENLHFRMDERGQFYAKNKLMPYDEVKTRAAYVISSNSENGSAVHSSLTVEIPPYSKASDASLAGRLAELQKIAKAADRSFYVMWDMTGLEEE